jgi:hypothetical protein
VATVVFKDVPMHLHHRIEVRRRYVFTALKKTTIFKDDPALRCELLKPSSKTTIVPLGPDERMPPPPPPPPPHTTESARSGKRRRLVKPTDEGAVVAGASQPPSSRLGAPTSDAMEGHRGSGCREVPLYTGTVTAVVHAKGMLYELDGVVLLLCSHWQTVSRARELRIGNRVRVYNAHALFGPAPEWPSAGVDRERHVGVLACCVRSTIDVVAFGPLDRPAVIANWSNPLLKRFSKQLTLARFLGFLPVCDAMADKFGGVDPGGELGSRVLLSQHTSEQTLLSHSVCNNSSSSKHCFTRCWSKLCQPYPFRACF